MGSGCTFMLALPMWLDGATRFGAFDALGRYLKLMLENEDTGLHSTVTILYRI